MRAELIELQHHVRELGRLYPDRVYHRGETLSGHKEACKYAPTAANEFGCIMGKALTECGVNLDPSWDREGGLPVDVVLGRLGWAQRTTIDMESAVIADWLRVVQHEQDKGRTWSQAIETAETQPKPTEPEGC